MTTAALACKPYNPAMTPTEGELPRDWHPLLNDLHTALVAKMEAEGLSQAAVETATGIPNANLSRFLKRQRGFSWKTAAALADFLGLTLALNPKPTARRPRKT